MVDAVLASGLGDQVRAGAAGGAKLFPVSQALPGVWRIDLGAAAVVAIIALVRALRKVAVLLGEISRVDALALAARRRSASPCTQ
jgi:hypothetical protein